jgi:hypothetical protein
MADTESEKINSTAGREIKAPCCGTCTGETHHEIVVSLDRFGTVDPGRYSTDWNQDYQIVRCCGCKKISFRKASWCEHDVVQVGDDEFEVQAAITLHPPRIGGRRGLGDNHEFVPIAVVRIYEETVAALSNSQPVLTGIGLRALVETVCKDRSAPGKDLYHKIGGLTQQGILTPAAAGILHKVRTLGNDAAHEVKPHSLEQLSVALDIVEHLLKEVYILPALSSKTFVEEHVDDEL